VVKKLTFDRVGAAASWGAAAADEADNDSVEGGCTADAYGCEAGDAEAWYSTPAWGWLPVRRVIH
jgi:hypothetical protein